MKQQKYRHDLPLRVKIATINDIYQTDVSLFNNIEVKLNMSFGLSVGFLL